ncbi:MAG: hypothetical protein EOP45_21810 [Sphingobacteriaceae bacterium]|nr:MAG: hypothetical protein EOP45_21810 [Sphingobacteriaceae bacterium]
MDHPLIDIGLNLTNPKYANRLVEVLENANRANISHILITGTNIYKSKNAIALAKRYPPCNSPILKTTFGVHPHDAKSAADTEKLKKEIINAVQNNPDVIKAVGECGLDFNRMFSPKDIQLKVNFVSHLNLIEFLIRFFQA